MATIQTTIRIRDGFSSVLDRYVNRVNSATNSQRRLNNEMRSAPADALTSRIGSLVGAYSALYAASKMISLSDNFTLATARLNLLTDEMKNANGEQEKTLDLQNKIYEAANRSRGSFMDMTQSVSKLGLLAGKAFGSTDEIVAFTETLNKAFTVGGTGSREKSMAMYQLTQAMSSGRLQGDEFRSIIENAPQLAKSIEDYMRKVKGVTGTMKEWSAQGLLTADVIKTAVFNAADDINKKFESLPYTWEQIWEIMKNKFVMAMQPILAGISWVANNWKKIAPIVAAVTAVMLGYVVVVKSATIAAWALSVAQNIGAVATFFLQGVLWIAATALSVFASACGAATLAQNLLNIAMSLSPIGILIMIIGLLIYKFVKLAQKLGSIYAAWLTVWDAICQATRTDAANIISIVQTLVNGVISLINQMIGLLNKLPGVSIKAIGTVTWENDFLKYSAKKHSQRQAKIKELVDNAKSGQDSYNMKIPNTGAAGGSAGGDAAKNAKNAAKTANAVTKSSEDLKWLREIAERKAINKFTTAEIKVDMGGINNVVNSELDLDGVVTHLENTLTEKMAAVAEGTHI